MNFNQIQQLLAVEKFGTLSAAAGELHISQPALSRSMQKLEQELGVELFTRTKNHVELNEGGRVAVEYARPIISAADNFEGKMREYKRNQTTISIGSCAPGPMWVISSELVLHLPGRTITSEMRPTEALEEGVVTGMYHLAILDRTPVRDNLICRNYLTERLFVALPPAHPLASKAGIRLSELAGQTMLLYADLGIWQKLCEEKMKQVHFIIQRDRDVFADLVTASALPNFTTNLMQRLMPLPMERIAVPVLDAEASIPFYLCVLERNRRLLDKVPHVTL